jgi:bifunctional DNA-binding transcriptional regulator/antitoxin component of YhaV-PrlF toxin-antitoxin module
VSKVTSKLQVTVPKALAQQYGIRPGDQIDWVPADAAIRLVPSRARARRVTAEERLALFDQATARQRRRQRGQRQRRTATRGWSREDLYDRGRAR